MSLADRSAADAAQRIADTLESAGVSYAIGGALALAIAGVPRGTADVDVNVFVPESQVGNVITVLAQLGIDFTVGAVDAHAVPAANEHPLPARLLDVFLPSIPFAFEAERCRVRVTDDSGWSGWFLSAEALAVFKLLFFRGKDFVDLERLVAVSPRARHGIRAPLDSWT